MTPKLTVLFLVLYLNISLGTPTMKQIEYPPKAYHYRAEIIDLIEKIVTTFEFWRNSENDMRVDYYNGIERKFITNGDGTIVRYEADKNGDTEQVCAKGKTRHYKLLYTYILFDLDDFDLAGEKTLNEYSIQIYSQKDLDIETTLYMNDSIPIRLEKKSLSDRNGEREHTITNYVMFEAEVNEEDLDPSQFCDEFTKTNENTDTRKGELTKGDKNFSGFEKYDDDEPEYKMRERILRKNVELVREHNSKNLGYKLALNQFADLTPEEMMMFTGDLSDNMDLELGTHPFPHTALEIEEMIDDIPKEWDWRIQGKVSKVKSQSKCGSCWAFAATATIESALSIKNGTNFDLSEQAFIDCAWAYNSDGCQGGTAKRAFRFAIDHGVPTEMDYGEYLATNGRCLLNETSRIYRLKGFTAVTPMSVNALKATVYKYGPVAVSIFTTDEFHFYSSGIYKDIEPPPNRTTHAVVVVGYGVRDGVPYWIVKNSWGQRWGEDGYVLIAATNNTANLLKKPYLPIV